MAIRLYPPRDFSGENQSTLAWKHSEWSPFLREHWELCRPNCGSVSSYPGVAGQMTSLLFSIKSPSICAAHGAKHTYVGIADEICMRREANPTSSLKGNNDSP